MDFLNIEHYFKYMSLYGLGNALLLGLCIEKLSIKFHEISVERVLRSVHLTAFAFSAMTALCYWLVYPNFLDHVEPTIATLGLLIKAGSDLYPDLNSYSFHGLLYGPLLAEIQAVAQFATTDPIANAKLPGVLAFFGLFAVSAWAFRSSIAKGYLIIILPFGLFAFWNRADSIFLFIVMLGWIASRLLTAKSILVLGMLSGLATSLKLHGFLYLAPFFFLAFIKKSLSLKLSMQAVGVYMLGFFLTFTICFTPPQVSVLQYFSYLTLALKHGISGELLERNIFFLGFLLMPLMSNCISINDKKIYYLVLFPTIMIELFASFIGAKPGAGVHHLLPFVVTNACLLEYLEKDSGVRLKIRYQYAFILLAFYAIFVNIKIIRNELINNYVIQQQIKKEFTQLATKYPNALVGYSNAETYSSTFYRVLMQANGSVQTDAAAFMDLNYSGLSDQPLIDAFSQCIHTEIIMPKQGDAFSVLNFYNHQPLFSDGLRAEFNKNYIQVEIGKYYSVYECKAKEKIDF